MTNANEGSPRIAMSKSIRILTVIICVNLFISVNLIAQGAKATGNERVDHLLPQMSLEEKIAMIHGVGEDALTYQGEAGYLPGIKRLGIPPMRFADGPPGVLTRVPSIALTSTMGVASTFSREDARLNGTVIGVKLAPVESAYLCSHSSTWIATSRLRAATTPLAKIRS
jgi:beta-glucosidase